MKMSTKKCLPNEKLFPKSSDMGLLRFRRTIKMRVDRCQGILKKIDHDSKLMNLCFRQLMDLMDDCRKIVKVEQELNLHLLQLLDGYSSGKIDLSTKTQTVSPMIAGFPLKRASIMLKRLDPLRELQSNSNLREESNRTRMEPTNGTNASVLHEDVQPLNRETLIISSRNEDLNSSVDIMLPNCEVRCRRWPNPVSPASCREFHLKQASIPLIRLDLQSHIIPEGGAGELNTSPNGPFCGLDMESGAFESDPSGSSPVNIESNHSSPDSTWISEEQSNFQAHSQMKPCIRLSPFVVLERLDFAPGCGGSRSSFVLPSSLSYNSYNGVQLPQISCNSHSENDNGERCKHSLKYSTTNGEEVHETDVDPTEEEDDDDEEEGESRTHSSKICDKSARTARNIGNSSKEKKLGPKRIIASKSIKRKKTDCSNKRSKLCHSFSHDKRNTLEMEMEEDPLEGPSWLYKDGMLKKARLMELEKIRKDYLISFHYLPPTVYSSSEESGDEENREVSISHKLRKRRSARRS